MNLATPLTPSHDLLLQQVELEEEMTQQGIERFRAALTKAKEEGREDATVYGQSLMSALIAKVSEGIATFMAERGAGKAGPKGPAYKCLKGFEGDFDVVSMITLRIILSGLSGRNITMPYMAGRIGRAVEDEFRYRDVRAQDRKLYQRLQEEANKRSAYQVKRKVVNFYINRREVDLPDPWAEKDVVMLGLHLIQIVITSTGLVETQLDTSTMNNRRTLMVPTEETKAFINNRAASAEALRPVYEPMVVPPADWTGPMSGGYLTRRVRPLRLVKSFNRQYIAAIETQDLTDVLASVNAAQRTAWSINPFILTALEMGWERDYSLGGIPPMYDIPLPPKPHDIETNEEARKEWRSEAHGVHVDNLELAAKRVTFISGLNIARRYSHFDAIYFPYQLDFRGRIYAAPLLNPQGPDWMKALLQFSEGKPLDEESAPFLAIHLANTGAFGKIDKAPLEDRVQWVYDNQDAILDCAENPFDNRWWTEADSPYCFLAACREWAGWCREGVGFMSHLAVALDGSCSGIQHFSMAMADEVGGAAVNLVPSDKPSDIYTLVLEQALAQVKHDARPENEEVINSMGRDILVREVAQAWLRSGLLNRSCFKRPTMTFGYGSSLFGFREQIFSDTLWPAYREFKRGIGEWHFEDNGYVGSIYLSRVTLNAVEATVLKAAEAMSWLKMVAKVVTSEGLPVRWTTPDGFLVVQDYRVQDTHRIDTVLFGTRLQVNVQTSTPEVDKRKQASSLSPNFVHSLDANHLRLAVRRAAEEGISSFALIHDSFGTHAADTGRFFAILRETMVEMYRDMDVIQNFHAEIAGQLTEENLGNLPAPPAFGSLDVEAVVDCDFAFA